MSDTTPYSVITQIHDTAGTAYNYTNSPEGTQGTVNAYTAEDLKKRRNKQLAVWVTLIIIIFGSLALYQFIKMKKESKKQ